MVDKTTMQVSEENLERLARGQSERGDSYDAVLTRIFEGDLDPEDLLEEDSKTSQTRASANN